MKSWIQPYGVALTVATWLAAPAEAWLRGRYPDSELVERSELIVVGSLVPESIEFRWHEPDLGRSWEYRAQLVVRDVLKGQLEEPVEGAQTTIPIVIHYGLTPVVGGYSLRGDEWIDHRPPWREVLPKQIEIYDSGTSAVQIEPLVDDAREDIIWCLRRGLRDPDVSSPDDDLLGIRDPEDMQPLALEDYFLAFLGPDTEDILRADWLDHPLASKRARVYIDRIDIQRILELDDPKRQAELLVPFYLREFYRPRRTSPARQGLIALGPEAGRALHRVFEEETDDNIRQDILRLWGEVRDRDAVPALIDLLMEHEEFWDQQQLPTGWWNERSPENAEFHRRYQEAYPAIYSLWQISDPRASEAVRLTEERWRRIAPENQRIVKICQRALEQFARVAARR